LARLILNSPTSYWKIIAESVYYPHSLNWMVRVQATCHTNSKSRMNTMFAKSVASAKSF